MANLAQAKKKAADADAQQGTGGLLTRKVDAAAKALLTKKVNPNQSWQAILDVDKSYSIANEYRNGSVQDVVERVLGFAVIVDDDGTVPLVTFGGNIRDYVVKLNDFKDFIRRNRIEVDGTTPLTESLIRVAELTGNGDLFGGGGLLRRGSASAPSVRKMVTPAFVTIVTDGRPDNAQSATDAVQRLSYRGVFLKFLYLGNDAAGWRFLESLDDDIPVGVPYERGGRLIDNVDAKEVNSLAGMSDEDFYSLMFDEVSTWLVAARQNGLI